MLQPFTIPGPLSNDTPFTETHFWAWANEQKDRTEVGIFQYLSSLGFVKGAHKITPEELTILESLNEGWHVATPRMRGQYRFADLLTPATTGGYWVQGKEGRYAMTQALLSALVDSGWIYKPHPDNTYFEIINGHLFAKYQQIIGSRRMAELTE